MEELSHQGLIPELFRGQSLKFDLSSSRVPMGNIILQLALERVEVGELLAHGGSVPEVGVTT